MFSDELSIDDLFHGINMVSLLNALFLTISCVVPASFNHEDMAEMNTRTYAGPDIWESVFLAEDVLDMRQLNVSRPSYEIDAGISLPSLEGCWGCRDGVMYTVMRNNFDMSAPPSILLAHGLAIIFTIQTLSLFLGLLLTLSAGPVRSAKPFYKIEGEAEDEVADGTNKAAGEGEKEKSTKATDGFGFGSIAIAKINAVTTLGGELRGEGVVAEIWSQDFKKQDPQTREKMDKGKKKKLKKLLGTDPIGKWMKISKYIYLTMFLLAIAGIVLTYSTLFELMNVMYPHPLAKQICKDNGWVADPTDPSRYINGSFVGCQLPFSNGKNDINLYQGYFWHRFQAYKVPELWNGDYYVFSVTYISWYVILSSLILVGVIGGVNFFAERNADNKFEQARECINEFDGALIPVLQRGNISFEVLKSFENDPIFLDKFTKNIGFDNPGDRANRIKFLRDI